MIIYPCRRLRPSLMLASAGPIGLTALLLPERYAALGQVAAALALLGAAMGLLWLTLAYAGYRQRRRRFHRVLVAEGACKARRPRRRALLRDASCGATAR